MAELPPTLVDALERADALALSRGYRAVSVSPERVRAWLRLRRLGFVDPAAPEPPPLSELDRAAEAVIERARASIGGLAGAASLAGAPTLGAEIAGTAVVVLRLAQRLCVVYGFDPSTDRGRMAVVRALAAAWQVELPESGAVGLRLSDLPAALAPGGDPAAVGARLVRATVLGSVGWVAAAQRLVPVLPARRRVWESRARVADAGRRMQQVLRRLAEVPPSLARPVEEAVELPPRVR